jgi:hypothetical protein
MREQELAAHLFEWGVQSGLSMDRVIDELGAINWPSFIDATTFRASLGGAAEAQLRRQMEEQLAMIRRKIGGETSAAYAPPLTHMPAATPAAPAAASMNAYVQPQPQPQPSVTFLPEPAPVAASPAAPAPTPAPAPPAPAPVGRVAAEHVLPDDVLQTDETMVWLTHHGKRSDSE